MTKPVEKKQLFSEHLGDVLGLDISKPENIAKIVLALRSAFEQLGEHASVSLKF
jgi:hypothetical protein